MRPALSDYQHLASGKVRELYRIDDEHLLFVAIRSDLGVRLHPRLRDTRQGPHPDRDERLLLRLRRGAQPPGRPTRRRAHPRRGARPGAGGAGTGDGAGGARGPRLPDRLGPIDYQKTGKVCGIALPPGLAEASKFVEPLFTPATKAELGQHDENITFNDVIELVGAVSANQLRERTLQTYIQGADHALTKGIIVADTKFEFGVDKDGNLRAGRRGLHPGLRAVLARRRLPGGRRPARASTSSSSATG